MKVLRFLDKHFEEYLLFVLLVAITFNTCLQTVMRYFFNHALSWTDELSKFCFIYSGFLSIGYCIRNHIMVRIDIIKSLVHSRVFAVLSTLVTLIMLAFFAVLFVASFGTFQAFYEGHMLSPALDVPMYYLYLGAIIGPGLGIIRCLQSLITYDIPLCLGKEVQV